MEPTVEVNAEVEKARTRLLALEAQAAKLDNQRITLQVDIDNARLEASANRMVGLFSGLRGRVSDFGADVRNTSDAVEGLGNTMSAASKVVFLAGAISQLGTFVAALAPASGALLALPAIAFAVAGGFAVVKLATSGMGDAFSAVADGDAKKLNEAMAKLSPAAQQVVRKYQELKPAFDALKLKVQNEFWDEQATVLGRLVSTYLPVLDDQLVTIARSMGNMVASSADALMAPETVAAVNTVLSGTSDLFQELGSAPGDFLAGLFQIGSVGAQYLGAIGETLGSLAMRFRLWSESAEGQAQINAWIQQGWRVLTQLYDILVNIGSIAIGIFRPLMTDGQGLLVTLVALTAQAAAWVNSAQGQQTIAAIWSTLKTVASALMSAIGLLVGIVAQLMVWFSQLPGPVQSVIAQFLAWGTIIGLVLAKAAPLIAFLIQIAPLIARLGPLLTGLATAFRVVMTVFRALSLLMLTNPWVLLIVGLVALVAAIIMNWDTIKSYLSAAWNFILSAWNAFVGFLSSTGSSVWSTISAAWTSAISALASFFGPIWEGIKAVWNSVITTLTTAGSNVWNVISGIWQAVISGLVAFFQTAWTVVTSVWTALIDTILAIGSAVWETIKTIWFAAILTIWALLTGQFDLLGTIWGTLIDKIKAIGSNLWNQIYSIWSGAISNIVSAVTNFVSNMISAISNFVSRAVAFFTQLGSQIISAVTNFVSQTVARVSQFVSQVISFFSNLASQGPSRISAMVSSIISYVGNLASQFVSRVSSMAGQVVARMGALAGQIVSAIASLPGRMVSLGASIIQGIISGISGAAGRLFSYLGGLATQALNAAKAAFGIGSPSKLFADEIGEFIPSGIEVGVDANTGGMLKNIGDLASMAQRAALDALSRPELARVGSLVGANAASSSAALSGASTAAAIAPSGAGTTMQIGSLTVNVKGIVDPNDPVAWRRFGEDLKDLIKDVEDSYK
jgi:phage-related protein